MKCFLKLCIIVTLLFNTTIYALNPVPGFYAGILLGANYTPNFNLNFTSPFTHQPLTKGTLVYSVFGDIGGEIGYRINQFRIEGEVFFNNSPYNSLLINRTRYTQKTKSTGLRIQGQTNTLSFMANGYYDVFFNGEQSNLVPYIGLGIGYAHVANKLNFYCNNQKVGTNTIFINPNKTCTLIPFTNAHTSSYFNSTNLGAAQVIFGLSYFLDDFTTISFDFRDFATARANKRNHSNTNQSNNRAQFLTFNFGVNSAFDFG